MEFVFGWSWLGLWCGFCACVVACRALGFQRQFSSADGSSLLSYTTQLAVNVCHRLCDLLEFCVAAGGWPVDGALASTSSLETKVWWCG